MIITNSPPPPVIWNVQQLVSELWFLGESLTIRGKSDGTQTTNSIFDESDYSSWKESMRGYMISIGYTTWKHVEMKHVFPQNGLKTQDEITSYEENEKARYANFSALSKIELSKFISLNITYEVWEKLKQIYEGNNRFKLSNKLIVKCHYDNLKMEEGEDIRSYF